MTDQIIRTALSALQELLKFPEWFTEQEREHIQGTIEALSSVLHYPVKL